MDEMVYHIPALLTETIDGLAIDPSGVYADATFGGGGHSRAIMERLGPQGHLYGFDRDLDALANSIDDPRFTFVHSNFRYMRNFLRFYGAGAIDGIVADLGVSFHHFDDAERGFTFRENAPLDMRMTRTSSLSAADIVNEYDQRSLATLLRIYGEVDRPMQIAEMIVKTRSKGGIHTTGQLVEAVKAGLNPRREKKDLACIFQALRIEVNGEMDSLRGFLESTIHILRPGGRLAVLTYHSLEDRMVKNFLKSGNVEGNVEKDFFGRISTPWRLITRQPLTSSPEEVLRNPRSRSAKLRIAELMFNPTNSPDHG